MSTDGVHYVPDGFRHSGRLSGDSADVAESCRRHLDRATPNPGSWGGADAFVSRITSTRDGQARGARRASEGRDNMAQADYRVASIGDDTEHAASSALSYGATLSGGGDDGGPRTESAQHSGSHDSVDSAAPETDSHVYRHDPAVLEGMTGGDSSDEPGEPGAADGSPGPPDAAGEGNAGAPEREAFHSQGADLSGVIEEMGLGSDTTPTEQQTIEESPWYRPVDQPVHTTFDS